MTNETRHNSDPFMDFSMTMLDIENKIRELGRKYDDCMFDTNYWSEIAELASRFYNYLDEGLQLYPDNLPLSMEAETIARALSKEMIDDFSLKFIELVYASISDPLFTIDAITNPGPLKRAVAMTEVTTILNNYSENRFVVQNRVRQTCDAVVGRAVLTAVSFNVNPLALGILRW